MKAWSKQKGSDFFVYPYLFYFLKQTNLDFLSTYKHIHTKPRQYIYPYYIIAVSVYIYIYIYIYYI